MRASALKGLALLVKPGALKSEKGRDGEDWDYYVCEVHALNDSGIEKSGTGVRFSWKRSMKQLKEANGGWLAVRPVEDGNAVILEALTGSELAVAERVLDDLDEGVD
jgi:hypothetical protein